MIKGWFGELQVRVAIWIYSKFSKQPLHRFHNVYLAVPDGSSTQIDHIFVSKCGIFIVETKNMTGWIFGKENAKTWTQVIYKKKYPFQNPLRQNYAHVKAFASLFDFITPEVIHSVVVFVGKSSFKTTMPEKVVHSGGLIRYIRSKSEEILSDSHVEDIVQAIKYGKLENTFRTRREHIRRIKSRKDPDSKQICHCGSPMILRTTRRRLNQGRQFWGCSRYPSCKFKRDMEA